MWKIPENYEDGDMAGSREMSRAGRCLRVVLVVNSGSCWLTFSLQLPSTLTYSPVSTYVSVLLLIQSPASDPSAPVKLLRQKSNPMKTVSLHLTSLTFLVTPLF